MKPTSKHYKQFASKHGLVYLGSADEHYEPIAGVTLGKLSSDHELATGAVDGHDITVLNREIKLDGQALNWHIVQLSTDTLLPHIFIDGHSHNSDIYKKVFAGTGHYRNIDSTMSSILSHFPAHFKTYTDIKNINVVPEHISQNLLNLIYNHGYNLDYELDEHYVRVLNLTDKISVEQLDDMFVLAQHLVASTEETL